MGNGRATLTLVWRTIATSMASNADGEDESDPYGAEDNSSSHSGEDTDNGQKLSDDRTLT